MHKVFLGKDGLRAGWGLLIFVVLFISLMVLANGISHKIHPSVAGAVATGVHEMHLTSNFINTSVPLLAIILVTWIMSKIERRPQSAYGFGGTRKLPNLVIGLGAGVIFLSLLILALMKSGFLAIDARLLFGLDIIRFGVAWLVCFFVVAFMEEYLTRGYVLFTLARGLAGIYRLVFKTQRSKALGFWTAALALSFLFGLGHGKSVGESPIGLLSAGLASLVFCLSLWRTGSLWWAIGFHATWDWAQSFLYGVADSGSMVQHHFLATHAVGKPILSGGTTGPEGSLFVLAILALAAGTILFTLPSRPWPETEA